MRTARGGWAALGLWGLLLGVLAAGCNGPGLEPPWSDDEARSGGQTTGGSVLPAGGAAAPGTDDGDFGNSGGGGASGATGGSAAPATPTTTPPPTAAAGSGAVQPPVTNPDPMGGAGGAAGAAPADPGAAGMSAGGAFTGIDFVPDCDTEAPLALESSEACRYPLPADAALDLGALQISALQGMDAALLARGQSELGCLFGSAYYVDVGVMPPEVVLCADACAALPEEAQLVLIEGCPPPP